MTHKIRSLLVMLVIGIVFTCGGVTSGTKCTLKCDHITDDVEWDECMLKCHKEVAE
jgi:hypothetical protein